MHDNDDNLVQAKSQSSVAPRGVLDTLLLFTPSERWWWWWL